MRYVLSSWKNTITGKIMMLFLLILMPIYGIGIGLYNWSARSIQTEITSSVLMNIDFYLQGLEKELERVTVLQQDLLQDMSLKRVSNNWEVMSDYERSRELISLQQKAFAVKNSSAYIEDVTVYIPSMKRSMSAVAGFNVLNEAVFERLVELKTAGSRHVYWQDSGHMIATASYGDWVKRKEPLYLIDIALSEQEIAKALAQFNNYAESGSFLIGNTGAPNIAATSDESVRRLAEASLLERAMASSRDAFTFEAGSTAFLAAFSKSDKLGLVLCKFIPEQVVYRNAGAIKIWLWIYPVVSVVVIVLFCLSIFRMVHKPLRTLIQSFAVLEEGRMDIAITHERNDEFNRLYYRFNRMVGKLKSLIEQVYEQKIIAQRAEMKHLQSQINPHFLYNSFYILHRLIKMGEYDKSDLFARYLGDFLKFITRSSANENKLSEEMDHTLTYVNIQSLRFQRRIVFDMGECPERFKHLMVPRLIVQPIIENAIEHGLKNKPDDGKIRLAFEERGDSGLAIVIEDNGNRLGEAEIGAMADSLSDSRGESEVTGLVNIHRRIKIKFGGDSGIRLSRSELDGLKVEIVMMTDKEA